MQRIAGTPERDRGGAYAVPAPVNALQALAFAMAASLTLYMAVLGMREATRDDVHLGLRKDKEAGVEMKQPTPLPVPSPTREGLEPVLGN